MFVIYFFGKMCTVEIGHDSSEVGNMETDVIQGTILAPIFYFQYI